jgi:RNA polymerase sigma-54 factor
MLKIMKAILALQSQFFVTGDRMELKPMILKDIADLVEMDISTVSRITCNKYVSTPFGHVLLKSLFSEGLTDMSGKKVSARVIQEALKQTIENENKRSPYTDYQLVNKLAQSGFKLARRTIAKYREMLKIPTAQVRAVWG